MTEPILDGIIYSKGVQTMRGFHPIGTVVLLINGTKPIMIYGRLQHRNASEEVFDYVACLYPEGNINNDHNIFFNNQDIAPLPLKY
jgi:hypothetical protein